MRFVFSLLMFPSIDRCLKQNGYRTIDLARVYAFREEPNGCFEGWIEMQTEGVLMLNTDPDMAHEFEMGRISKAVQSMSHLPHTIVNSIVIEPLKIDEKDLGVSVVNETRFEPPRLLGAVLESTRAMQDASKPHKPPRA